MNVYENETDTVIAASPADAQAVIEEHCGYTFEQEGLSLDDLELVPPDRVITICNWDGNGADSKRSQTAAEWAAECGRSFLCSTEW